MNKEPTREEGIQYLSNGFCNTVFPIQYNLMNTKAIKQLREVKLHYSILVIVKNTFHYAGHYHIQ